MSAILLTNLFPSITSVVPLLLLFPPLLIFPPLQPAYWTAIVMMITQSLSTLIVTAMMKSVINPVV